MVVMLLFRTNGTSAAMYGLSLGNANAGSNWLAFMARMGINYGRLFVATNVDLRKTLGGNFGARGCLLLTLRDVGFKGLNCLFQIANRAELCARSPIESSCAFTVITTCLLKP